MDYATGNYQSTISVTNTDQTSFDPSYVLAPDGVMSLTDKQNFWTRCQALRVRCRQLSNPPAELTDLVWANSPPGIPGGCHDIASRYLDSWINWMFNPTVSFKIHMNRAMMWEECHRFILQLPHQTNNTQIECITTGLVFNPNVPYDVTVTAIMFSDTIPSDFYFQDVVDVLTNDKNWQDTYSTPPNYQDTL